MQILHWIFKVAHEQAKEDFTSTPKQSIDRESDQAIRKDIVVFKHRRSSRNSERVRKSAKFSSKGFGPLAFLCRKDVAKACFYSTINLRRINSFDKRERWIHSMRMKKDEIIAQGPSSSDKADSGPHGGNKVLPINDTVLSSSNNKNDQCGPLEKKNKLKGDKTKTMSRMKELLRWAAAAKSDKGAKFMARKVLHFRNRVTLKTVPDDDQLSNESPKISFRWDLESCSTTSSVYSAISMASSKNDQTLNMLSLNSTPSHDRKGNWITTDSEFVVLEL